MDLIECQKEDCNQSVSKKEIFEIDGKIFCSMECLKPYRDEKIALEKEKENANKKHTTIRMTDSGSASAY